MIQFASFIPPGAPIPDPPHMKWIAAAISALFSIGMVLIIAFIVLDFSLEQIGIPIGVQPPETMQGPFEEVPPKKELSPEEIVAQYHIVSPLPDVQIENDDFAVICRWDPGEGNRDMPPVNPQLYIDEVLHPWTIQFGQSTWVAQVRLEDGPHRIRFVGETIGIFKESPSPIKKTTVPVGKRIMKLHPDTGDLNHCGDCHSWIEKRDDMVRRGRGLTLGPWKGNESCIACHQTEELEPLHANVPVPTEDCGSCHVVHGTAVHEKGLLKAPKAELFRRQ